MPSLMRGTPPTPALLALSMGVIGLQEEEAHLLWRTAWESTDPTLRAWRFAVDHIMESLMHGAGSQTMLDAYLRGPFSARAIIDVTERLWHECRLSRKQANAYQNGILAHAGRDGRWVLARYVPPSHDKPAGVEFRHTA
jgi:hypothetical protein